MDDLHLSITAMVLYFNLLGAAGSKSQQLHPTHHHSGCRWDGKFSMNCSSAGLSAVPEGISQTAAIAALNCNRVKTVLCASKRNEDWMLKHLDLSNNLISELSITAFRNLPGLETLNLNGNSINTFTLDIQTPEHGSKGFGKAHRFLPALKVLSAEGNNLDAVPTGLGLLQSLQTVHLSFNGILEIGLNDFQNCSQLKNIYLQNNRIAKIHPDAFKDLNKLQVVDLRENALTTTLPQILIYLNTFQLKVDLSNNPWVFNCRLQAVRHLTHFLSDSTRKRSSTSYNKTASSSQKPLLHLSSLHLSCSNSIVFQTAAVDPGETLVLLCGVGKARGNGVSWWTPRGRISQESSSLPHMALDKMSNLVISNADKTAEGLYMCASNATTQKYLIYNVQVRERVSAFLVRRARATSPVFRRGKTEQDLALAVCLSVLVTFVCAFCLGALARPCLTRLWVRLRGGRAPAPEHTYVNHSFSDETLSRERSASKLTYTEHGMFAFYENSAKNTGTFPTETSQELYECVSVPTVPSASTDELPKQSSRETDTKEKMFSDIKTNSSDATYINVGQLSARTDDKNSNEITPRKLRSNGASLWEEPKQANSKGPEQSRFPPTLSRLSSVHADPADTDLPHAGAAGIPSPTAEPRSSAQDPRGNSDSGWLHSQPAPGAPEQKGNISQHEAPGTTKHTPGRHNCDGELALNGNRNRTSDVGDLVSPSSCKRGANIKNLSVYQNPENSPHTEYNYKRDCTNEQGNIAAFFGDSSSDEGTPFTMSDCSSLEDFELEQPGVSSSPPLPLSSLGKADTDTSSRSSALPESLSIAAELRHIGKSGDKHDVYFGTTADYGSDTFTPEAAPPGTDKCSDHISISSSDSASSIPKVPDAFDYFTKEESTEQHSNSLYQQNFSAKHSPTYARDTESSPEDAELQLHQLPTQPWHLLRFSPTEQGEHTPGVSTEQLTDSSSSDSDHDEGDTALRWNTSTPENDRFIFTPIDAGLNETVKKAPLPRASIADNEQLLQSLPENTTETPFMVIAEKGEPLPQGEQVNTATAHEDKAQRVLSKEERDRYTALWGSSDCSSPDEMQPHSVTGDLLHTASSGKAQSVFNTENYFHLDLSEENTHASSAPSSPFNGSTQRSSGSFPQRATGDKNSGKTDPSELEGGTSLTGLEGDSTTATNLPHSSEKLSQRAQTRSGQGQFFGKKKRAFDGFANILQNRRTDLDS